MSQSHATHRVPSSPPQGARGFTLYLTVWLSLAVVSLAYIAVAMVRPDLLGEGRTVSAAPSDPAASSSAALERGLADVRGQLTDLQLKVIRGELREQELAARLGSLETRLDDLASANRSGAVGAAGAVGIPADRTTEAPPATPKTDRTGRSMPPVRTPVAAAPSAAAKPTDVDSAEAEAAQRPQPKTKGAALETASVGRSVPPFGAPEVSVEKGQSPPAAAVKAERGDEGPIGVQLGGAPSLDSLRLNWTILSDRHADSLGNLQARYVASDALGATSFNLIAGPVASRTDAIRICAKLRTQGITCRLTSFQGSALQ